MNAERLEKAKSWLERECHNLGKWPDPMGWLAENREIIRDLLALPDEAMESKEEKNG